MMSIRQLYELQEAEVQLQRQHARRVALNGQLAEPEAVKWAREDLEKEQTCLHAQHMQQQEDELQGAGLRERFAKLEEKLFSGRVTNPRELKAMEEESNMLKRQLRAVEDHLLEVMLALEETQKLVTNADSHFKGTDADWREQKKQLSKELAELDTSDADLVTHRDDLISRLTTRQLDLYRDIKKSKGGQVVARIEGGMCRGCRMTLTTDEVQKARISGEPSFCSNCGLILYVS